MRGMLLGMFCFIATSVWGRPNFNIDSLYYQPISDVRGCWGYVDPGTQNEYALICAGNRLEIRNVTNPASPVLTRSVAATGGELKQVRPYSHYVMASNQSGVSLQVINMDSIATNPSFVVTIRSYSVGGGAGSHALHIDGNYAYLGMNGAGPALRIVDISDPLNPVQVGQYQSPLNNADSHDSYVKGDTAYVAFLGGGFSILDISNKTAPQSLADVTYPSPRLTHNCWTTEDGKYLFTTDEVSNGYIRVWDVRDPRNPRQVGAWSAGVPGSDVHNVQVKGNFLYASYYGEGVEVLDIEDPTQPIEVGHFDTDPLGNGCWDFFNFFPSGTLVASNYYGSSNPGMWLFSFNGATAAKIKGLVTNQTNGAPLPEATVRSLEVGREAQTDLTGNYFIRSEGGTRTLEFSHNGFYPETVVVNLPYSDTTTVNLALTPLFDGQLTGQVLTADSGQPIQGVRVGLLGDAFFSDLTGVGGDFSVSFLPTGQPIQIATAFWGYQEKIDTLNLSSGIPLDTTFRLLRGYTDDFEFNLNWSTSALDDDATSGFWERVVPVAAFNGNGFQTQPGADHTADPGRLAFITGQVFPNATIDDHDVDGGKVTLTTPLIDLTGMNKPVLSFSRWYTNSGGQNILKDTFFVDISADSGVNWVNLEKYRFSASGWRTAQYALRNKVPLTNKTFVRFVAADRGGPSTVEAGVDDFKLIETLVTGDIDSNGIVNLVDIQTLINGTFLGTPVIPAERGDFSGDCLLTSADVVRLLNYFFLDFALTPTCLP